MERLIIAKLKLRFLRPEVAYLGNVIDREGVRSDPKKIEIDFLKARIVKINL